MKALGLVALAIWLVLGRVGAAWAQAPLTGDIVLAARLPGAYFETRPAAACDRSGVCALVWIGFYSQDSQRADLLAAVIAADGRIRVPTKQILSTHSLGSGGVFVVALDEGFAIVHEDQSGVGDAVLQYYDEQLQAQGDEIQIPMDVLDPRSGGILGLVRTKDGFAVFLDTTDQPLLTSGVSVAFIDDQGQVIHPGVELNVDTAVDWNFDGATAQPDGSVIAVYDSPNTSPMTIDMRRVSSSGELGPERVVASGGFQSLAAVAAARDGSFMVTWIRAPRPNTTEEIVAQRFSVRGRPLGKAFRVNEVFGLAQWFPAITVDANDHYFIAWQRFRIKGARDPGWDVDGRWFDKFGVPLTRELRISQQRTSEQQPTPQVAASSAATIVVGWGSDAFSEKGNESDGVPVARVFAIPR